MEVEILGSGGATTAPRPGCECRVCAEARANGGPPHARTGPSTFVQGICELDPFTGERRIHAEHPVLRFEATFEETLAIVDALGAGRVILSHLEEIDGLTYDDLLRLERQVGRNVTFAFDGLRTAV